MRVVSTDRYGGVSQAPYDSMNLSFGVGDTDSLVKANRDRVKKHYSIPLLLSAQQVHGDSIFILEEPLTEDKEVEGYDALVCTQVGVGLLIQQADCQAITLYDPVTSVIANIHCGWKGSVLNIAAKTIHYLNKRYGSNPQNIQAYISPSLGPCCAEFIHHSKELPPSFLAFETSKNHFNFWKISIDQLLTAGIVLENIQCEGVCTSCSNDYFSYRRACRMANSGGVTGRFGTIIVL